MTCLIPRLLLILITLSALTAEARIGESKSTIERRITSDNRGLEVDDEQLMNHYLNQTPLKSLVVTRDSSGGFVMRRDLGLSLAIFYRTNGERAFESQLTQKNGRPVDNPNGWLLFVVFHKGKSVLEYYQRSGNITQAEINGLLSLHQGGSTWVRDKLPEDKYPSEEYQPLLPHNLHREDADLLANSDSTSFLIFDVKVDDHISRMKKERENANAPNSLSGF